MPDFPPVFRGRDCTGSDPVAAAVEKGRDGDDPGLVAYDLSADRLRAAMLFAPEVPLAQAVTMLPLCALAFQNALGALAPPVVALHLGWDGVVWVNGGRCGRLTLHTEGDADAVPDWLVVGLSVDLWPADGEGGATPDRTALYAEGCAEITAPQLLEAWVRHTLSWLDTWDHDGVASLHRDWRSVARPADEQITVAGRTGTFVGIDEAFGLLLKSDGATTLVPLTDMIQDTP